MANGVDYRVDASHSTRSFITTAVVVGAMALLGSSAADSQSHSGDSHRLCRTEGTPTCALPLSRRELRVYVDAEIGEEHGNVRSLKSTRTPGDKTSVQSRRSRIIAEYKKGHISTCSARSFAAATGYREQFQAKSRGQSLGICHPKSWAIVPPRSLPMPHLIRG